MQHTKKLSFLPIFISLATFFFLLLPSKTFLAPRPVRWAYVYHGSRLSVAELKSAPSLYNVLALTGFRLTSLGSITTPKGGSFQSKLRAVKKAHRWYPVVTFTSPRDGEIILDSPEARRRAAVSLKSLVIKHRLTGLHFDFEYLRGAYAGRLARFIGEIKKSLPGTRLSMAIFPPVGFPRRLNRLHDPALLAPLLDEVVVMCYDWHRLKGPRGPVTALSWSEANIRHLLKYFKGEEILLGIPAYGYLWSASGQSTTLSARFVSRSRQCVTSRHPGSGTLALTCTRKGKKYQGYVADRYTRHDMKTLAKRYGLRGTALWRLGFQEINEVN